MNPRAEMTGGEVRIAERHLDIAVAGQRGDFRKRSSRPDAVYTKTGGQSAGAALRLKSCIQLLPSRA